LNYLIFGDVQSGRAPGQVRAASALAILQQEGSKGTSGYGYNMRFTRTAKAKLRLYMLWKQYQETPTLIKKKLEKIFGSVLYGEDREAQKIVMESMLDGSVDLDELVRSIRFFKYDVEMDTDPQTLLERQQILQELQVAAGFGVRPSREEVIDILPSLPVRMKEKMKLGVRKEEERINQMLRTEEGQAQLALEQKQTGKSKDGNQLVPSPFGKDGPLAMANM